MPTDYNPTDDATPIRAHRVIDPKEATTRRWKCRACGALNDPPLVAMPLEPRVPALDPVVPADLGPFYVKGHPKQLAETERLELPDAQ